MSRKLCGLAGVSSVLLVVAPLCAANAADLLLKAPAPAPYTWAGFYVGGNIGGAWDRAKFDPTATSAMLPPFAFTDVAGLYTGAPGTLVFVPGTIPLSATTTLNSGVRGSLLGGLQGGYNWQSGPVVYGLEGQIDGLNTSRAFAFAGPLLTFTGLATSVSESLSGSGTIERHWEGSFRGRLGYAQGRWLFYGTGGVAVTSITARGAFAYNLALGPTLTPIPGLPNPSGSTSGNTTKALVGPTIGAGTEYAVSRQVRLGIEYRHTFYDRQNISLGATPTLSSFAGPAIVTPGTPVGGNFRLDTDEVMVRLNWMFQR
jgi:opacity protein-like surface antigen